VEKKRDCNTKERRRNKVAQTTLTISNPSRLGKKNREGVTAIRKNRLVYKRQGVFQGGSSSGEGGNGARGTVGENHKGETPGNWT